MILHRMVMLGFTALLLSCGDGGEGNNAAERAAAGNEAAPGEAAQARGTIAEALAASPDHSAFVQALQSSGLIDTMRGAGPYTVFAPTNAAFDAIPADARRLLTAPGQRERLITLLSTHVVPGTVTAADLNRAIDRGRDARAELATVTGDNLALSRDGPAILLGDGAGGTARIIRADQVQSNGVVHSVDAVLMPGN
jgi:uncharacterized surface protein with fasciclin (FAS1) repeats